MPEGERSRQLPLGVVLFGYLARVMLPASFWRRFGTSLVRAVADQRRALGRRRLAAAALWLREFKGLAVTAVQERRAERSVAGTGRYEASRWRVSQVLATVAQDVRYAMRMIGKTPLVSFIAVASLALGVAASTSVFSLYHAWMIRSVTYPAGERLVVGWQRDELTDDEQDISPATYFAWVGNSGSFQQTMALSFSTASLTGGERPLRIWQSEVTPNLFATLEVSPLLGRAFGLTDGAAGSQPVVMISESLWRNAFGSDPGIVGNTIEVDDQVQTVVGVVPRSFDFVRGDVDVWRASDFEERRDDRSDHTLTFAGYLRPNVTLDEARLELTAAHQTLGQQYPDDYRGTSVRLMTIREFFPGPADRGFVTVVMAVVLLVLLVACVNIASLFMAKTEGRQREISIRTALGAGRGRIVFQLLTESTMLALLAAVIGLALAVPGVGYLATATPASIPASLAGPELTGSVVAFGLVIALLGGLVFGLVPVVQALGGRSEHLLDGNRSGTASRRRKRVRGAFVVAEFALALAILIGVASLTDLFSSRLGSNPGFDGARTLTARVELPQHRYPDAERRRDFIRELATSLSDQAAASASAMVSSLPRSQSVAAGEFTLPERFQTDDERAPRALQVSITPGYLSLMGMPLVRGRGIEVQDRAGQTPVALVNQRLADRFLEGADPVGRQLEVDGVSYRIVGVVGNVALERLDGLLPHEPAIYFSIDQRPVSSLTVVARPSSGDPHLLAGPVQAAVWAVDREQPVSDVMTMNEFVSLSLAGPNIASQLMMAVGSLALVLAAIGIYGVMAYTVTQEKRETGIRMALGARPGRVLAGVTRRGAALTLAGLLLGSPMAWLIVNRITAIVNDPQEFGPIAAGQIAIAPTPLIAAAAILALVGLVGSLLPARRATTVDPARVLAVE